MALFATVTTVGTALGDVGFAAERHTPRATVTTLSVQLSGIDKARHTNSLVTYPANSLGLTNITRLPKGIV